MIKVNKNGWLHRFNKATSSRSDYYWDHMTNFCEYFWRTVQNFAVLIVLSAMVYVALSLLGGALLGHDTAGTFVWWTWFAAPMVGLGAAGSPVGFIIGTTWLLTKARDKFRDRRNSTYEVRAEKKRLKKQRRDSNWIVVMYRSKKEKYCPSVKIE